jgi:hypothetical protein
LHCSSASPCRHKGVGAWLIRWIRFPVRRTWSGLPRHCLGGHGWAWCWPRVGPAAGIGHRRWLQGSAPAGGLSLVERAVRSLLAAGLEQILVVGHDAGPVATVVGRLRRGRVRVVYAARWADGNGASLAAVQSEVQGEALFLLVTADHIFCEGALVRLLAAVSRLCSSIPHPIGRAGKRELGFAW